MEKNSFQGIENRTLAMSEELLRFTGRRMPEYAWLIEGHSAEQRDNVVKSGGIDDKRC